MQNPYLPLPVFALLLLNACESEPIVHTNAGAAGASGSDAKVILGTGEAEYEPIEGEPTLEMAAGFQGGFHVWASFLASGFSEERLDMVLVTQLDGEPESAPLTMRATLKGTEAVGEEGEPVWSFAGYPAQMRDARCANGRRARVRVTLSDTFGHEASDERYCVLFLDEIYRDDSCN